MERLKGVRSLAAGGVCVALAVVLPLLFHSMAVLPRIVLPMHYPIFLAGTLLDPVSAAVVGLISPALSMALTGMPTPAQAFRMMGELATYGFVVSLVLSLAGGFRYSTCLVALVAGMILGRLVHVVLGMLLFGFRGWELLLALYLPGVPGMIAQLVFIPPLAIRVRGALRMSKL